MKRVKVNRPKALCFDYLQLKDMFGLELETEIVSDVVEQNEQEEKSYKISQQDLPF